MFADCQVGAGFRSHKYLGCVFSLGLVPCVCVCVCVYVGVVIKVGQGERRVFLIRHRRGRTNVLLQRFQVN